MMSDYSEPDVTGEQLSEGASAPEMEMDFNADVQSYDDLFPDDDQDKRQSSIERNLRDMETADDEFPVSVVNKELEVEDSSLVCHRADKDPKTPDASQSKDTALKAELTGTATTEIVEPANEDPKGQDEVAAQPGQDLPPTRMSEFLAVLQRNGITESDLMELIHNRSLLPNNEASNVGMAAKHPPGSMADAKVRDGPVSHEHSIKSKPDFIEVIDLTAEDGTPIKVEPKSPPRKRNNFDVATNGCDGDTMMDHAAENDLFVPEVPISPNNSHKRHKDKGSRPVGQKKGNNYKLSRTAKEWHRRRQLNPKYASHYRGIVWKEEQLRKIDNSVYGRAFEKKLAKQRKQKSTANNVDPRSFFATRNYDTGSSVAETNEDSTGVQRDFDDTLKSTKKDCYALFLAAAKASSGIDLHQCKKGKSDLDRDSCSFGLRRATPEWQGGKLRWKLKGMDSLLLCHQLFGTAFMIKRECSIEGPHGSICADDMGMGKTVQSIAVMVGNPPSPEDIKRGIKTTLIIVPSSIKDQWLDEIKTHAAKLGQLVTEFKASNKWMTDGILKACDVVLTTYWELLQSLPQPSPGEVQEWIADKKDIYSAYLKWVEKNKQKKGTLHQVEWYRVILDEGHFIKNHLCRTSRAAVDLKGRYRLLLSGTPIMNGFHEFFPIFRFLREPITSKLSFDEFKNTYCALEDDECIQKLSVILSDLIIRRTITDRLFNRPIVDLPKAYRFDTEIKPLTSEMILYRAIVIRLGEIKSETFGPNDPLRNLKCAFAQLTRLRQFIGNPDLIAPQIIWLFSERDLKTLQKKIKECKIPGRPKAYANMLYNRIGTWIKDKKRKIYKEVTVGTDDVLKKCQLCKDASEDLKQLNKCKHVFCDTCLDDNIHRALQSDKDSEDYEVLLCPERKCTKAYKESDKKDYVQSKAKGKVAAKDPSYARRKGKDARNFRPTPPPNQTAFSVWLEKFDNEEIDILPSSKLQQLLQQILEWIEKTPEDKIIVFTQFRHFQVMIGCMLEADKIKFVYYSGDMSSKQRHAAVEKFRTEPGIQIMVAGLKCGGLGLNLAFANRVILTDVWWNSCIDEQAFGRVHRIGQNKETQFKKLVLDKTIDANLIMILQLRKARGIKRALQDLNEEEQKMINENFEVDKSLQEFLDGVETEEDRDELCISEKHDSENNEDDPRSGDLPDPDAQDINSMDFTTQEIEDEDIDMYHLDTEEL